MIHRKNNCFSKTSPSLSLSATSTSAIASIIKPVVAFIIAASSVVGHTAILNDTSERRIEVRQGSSNSYQSNNSSSNVYITPSTRIRGDNMQGLIAQKQREYEFDAELSVEESKRVNVRQPSSNISYNDMGYQQATYNPRYNTTDNIYNQLADMDFNTWLNSNRFRAQEVANYQRYLSSQLGAQNVPPLEQLLTTARSWDRCGYEPYQLPPQELWSNIVPTLRLYSQLKSQGILPASSQIRSAYRSPGLNVCAGGASSSKHMSAGAIDIWVPEYSDNPWLISDLQDNLCQFWQYQGQSYNFGLGLYSSGAIHLDTQGYRKWGFSRAGGSFCRY